MLGIVHRYSVSDEKCGISPHKSFFLKKRTLLKFKMFLFKLSSAQYPKITNLKKKIVLQKKFLLLMDFRMLEANFTLKIIHIIF